MTRATFVNCEKPLITAIFKCQTPEEYIEKIRAAIAQGAEALGIHLCHLKREYRTEENLKAIFAACEGRPTYVTSYRDGDNTGFSDEECAELLLFAADCGATLCDVLGNLYDRTATKWEITYDPTAVEKQKELIRELHRRGSEVLMSSHTLALLTPEESLSLARAHAERGADISKLVNITQSEEELPKCIRTIQLLKSQAGVPFLYLLHGPCYPYIRQLGILMGVCMSLCALEYNPQDTTHSPLVPNALAIRDHYLP